METSPGVRSVMVEYEPRELGLSKLLEVILWHGLLSISVKFRMWGVIQSWLSCKWRRAC